MIEIPPDRLPEETLNGLIESFILREGTDYGLAEYDLASKVSQVRQQVHRGDVLVVFDSETESPNLMTRQMFKKIQKQNDTEN